MKHDVRWFLWLAAVLAIGCGHTRIPETVGDQSGAGIGGGAANGANNAGAGAGRGALAGAGGRSGAGGSTTVGMAGTSITPTVTMSTVRCGGTLCPVPGQDQYNLLSGLAATLGFPLPAGGLGLLPVACCSKSNVCGLQVNSDCVPAPKSDPRCPDVNLFGIVTPSCCIESQGICGMNGAQSGMGCMPATGGTAPVSCGSGDNDGGLDSTPVDAGI